jgi:hypothetical protein
MKKTVLLIFILSPFISFSQDTLKVKQIDSLVKVINQSDLIIETDSIVNDMPALGLYMKTYVTLSIKDSSFLRYTYNVNSSRIENGVAEKSNMVSIFYFADRQLIKVEESASMKGQNQTVKMEWYYSEDKPLYYTLRSDRAEERAQQLLEMAKAFYNTVQPKK